MADGQSFPWVLSKALGRTPTVDGQDGTGYVYSYNPTGRLFPRRAVTVLAEVRADTVVVMGGLNDQPKGDLSKAEAAGLRTFVGLERRFPTARVVVVGPAQTSFPIPRALRQIDVSLRSASAEAGVPYISPIKQDWFSKANISTYIDPATMHPNEAGQVFLARPIEASLRELKIVAEVDDRAGSPVPRSSSWRQGRRRASQVVRRVGVVRRVPGLPSVHLHDRRQR